MKYTKKLVNANFKEEKFAYLLKKRKGPENFRAFLLAWENTFS